MISFVSTHVVSWPGRNGPLFFPSMPTADGTFVDLRDYDGNFLPEWIAGLERDGVPAGIVESARTSEPPGFGLLLS